MQSWFTQNQQGVYFALNFEPPILNIAGTPYFIKGLGWGGGGFEGGLDFSFKKGGVGKIAGVVLKKGVSLIFTLTLFLKSNDIVDLGKIN